ncbi:MAG: alpha/beta hydrolase [Acidobacteriota bacterium]|nr:alpha/beta hydrolase [Acidobacteriota bacterium]
MPVPENWDRPPQTIDEWNAVVETLDRAPRDPQPVLDRYGVTFEPMEVNGVSAYLLTPSEIPVENRDRLLMHIHGGCYVMGGGPGGMFDGAILAGVGQLRVLSVDCRRPPVFRYPAALDDAVSAWRGAIEMADPTKMGILGVSAGGALTLSTVLRLKVERLPLPAAIAPGTSMADLTRTGDSFSTNHLVDNVLIGTDGRCQAMAELYAESHALHDPMLSPVYGDMSGFPPAILTTGTRDLLPSDTVRVHRNLRQAGVVADLHVFEAQAHGHYIRDVPEWREAFEEMARFFTTHLTQ